jgi:hypothetical protein
MNTRLKTIFPCKFHGDLAPQVSYFFFFFLAAFFLVAIVNASLKFDSLGPLTL